jgi:hypothetical protein
MAAVLKAIADLDVSPWEAAMGRLEAKASKFASGQLAAIGRNIGAAFSVYAVGRFVSSVGQAADRLDDLSKTTGVGVENLQALEVLFAENGKSAGDVSGVLARLKKSMDEATANTQIAQSFQRLGIAFEDVARSSPDRILEQIARAMQGAAGDMRTGEAAGNLLGRSYAELQGIMSELAARGLDPLRESLKSTNQIMGEDSVKAAARMQEAYDKLGRQMRTAAGNKATEFVGGLRGIFATGNKGAMIGAGVGGAAGMLALLGVLGAPLTGGASLLAVLGAGAIGAAGAGALTADYGKMGEYLFGKPDPGWTPKQARANAARRAASAEAMRAAATGKRDKAREWFREAVGKIRVGDVSAADSLARIGGYVGGQASPAVQIAERQLKIAELQKELQERIAKASEESAEAGRQTVAVLEE